MGRCSRCNRPLKDPTATIGPVCAGKAIKMKIRGLRTRPDGTRSYLIQDGAFTRIVRIADRDGARFAECECSTDKRCQHIELAASVDEEMKKTNE